MNQSQPEDSLVHNHVFEHYTEDYYECACGKQVDASQMIIKGEQPEWEESLKEMLGDVRTGVADDVCVYELVRSLLLKTRTAEQERVVGIVESKRLERVTSDRDGVLFYSNMAYNQALTDITEAIRNKELTD